MNRRSVLAALPAVMVAAPALSAQQADPLVALCDQWLVAWQQWEVASAGGINSPRLCQLDGIKADLMAQIKPLPIQTDAGCLAFWRFLDAEGYLADERDDYPDLHRWQLDKLRDWAKARATKEAAA